MWVEGSARPPAQVDSAATGASGPSPAPFRLRRRNVPGTRRNERTWGWSPWQLGERAPLNCRDNSGNPISKLWKFQLLQEATPDGSYKNQEHLWLVF
ncbi:hypothetical protein VULLAG_LOCUS22437 [Vulpes lagopus]